MNDHESELRFLLFALHSSQTHDTDRTCITLLTAHGAHEAYCSRIATDWLLLLEDGVPSSGS